LGAEKAATLREAQNAMLARFRSTLPGPTEPAIQRKLLRSRTGVQILKADVRFDFYSQPGLRRGRSPIRCVYYSFESAKDNRIYSFECWPHMRYGSYFDAVLDELARSITF
jgi:hypothetical protein